MDIKDMNIVCMQGQGGGIINAFLAKFNKADSTA